MGKILTHADSDDQLELGGQRNCAEICSLKDGGKFNLSLIHCQVIEGSEAVTSSHFEGRKAFTVFMEHTKDSCRELLSQFKSNFSMAKIHA